jgi:hypothetical protein
MGARVNYIFDDGTDSLVVLYSHWGANSIHHDLASAFAHAEPRKFDSSYWTRMVISHLIQDQLLDETGFGIFAIPRSELDSFDNWGINVIVSCETATHDYSGSDMYV